MSVSARISGDTITEREVRIVLPAGRARLHGSLAIPADAAGIVLFAQGSGNSHHNPDNVFLAHAVQRAGLATLLFDPLTEAEDTVDTRTQHYRFDIQLLAARLVGATNWLRNQADTHNLHVGFFGAGMGGGAALIAAASLPERISAIVSRGGQPELAGYALPRVKAPTLLIVGGFDTSLVEANREAYARLRCRKAIRTVPGATHLFEEEGALERVAELACSWFEDHLQGDSIAGAVRRAR